jgi:hypothetical protein
MGVEMWARAPRSCGVGGTSMGASSKLCLGGGFGNLKSPSSERVQPINPPKQSLSGAPFDVVVATARDAGAT